jgi:hypothetical protein
MEKSFVGLKKQKTNNMKKLIYASVIAACAIIITMLFAFKPKPEGEKGYIIMKVIEMSSNNWVDNIIVIAKEDGTVEKTPLKGIMHVDENMAVIHKAYNEIRLKGYKMISISGGDFITTYIFQKD